MTNTVYVITKYRFFEGGEWIVYISEDYEKAAKCFKEYKNKLKKQCGLQFCEYQYDFKINCEEGKRTIQHVINEDGCLRQWTEDGWKTLVKPSTPWRELM